MRCFELRQQGQQPGQRGAGQKTVRLFPHQRARDHAAETDDQRASGARFQIGGPVADHDGAAAWPDNRPLPDNSELRNGFIEMFGDEEHEMLHQLESSGANLGDLKIESPNLEDLFLKLTGHALRS